MLTMSIMLGIACVVMTVQQMKIVKLIQENQMLKDKSRAYIEMLKQWQRQDAEKGNFINL